MLHSQNQSARGALLESCLNVASGLVLSYLLLAFLIKPVYELDIDYTENFEIVLAFTVLSVIRSWTWRRIMNHASTS